MMQKWKLLTLLLTAILSACGGNGPEGLTVLSNGDLNVAQGSAQKGPFLAGSTVTINVLSPTTTKTTADKPMLSQTGKSFTLETTNTGTFDTNSLLFSANENFIQASVDGYYYDEISGERSSDQITLRGIFDLSTTSLNVNVLTDISRERIFKLARNACTLSITITNCTLSSTQLSSAIEQAEREVLAAFNIPIELLGSPQKRFGNMNFKKIADNSLFSPIDPADQVLLAVSALVMQIGQEGSGITEFINAFEADIADNGQIDSIDLKDRIARASATVNFSKVAYNMNSYYKTTKYVAADLQKWVDPSGGAIGVIAGRTEFYNASTSSSSTKYTSGIQTYVSTKATCLQLGSTDSASKIITKAKLVSLNTYYIPSNTPFDYSLESIPSSLNARAIVTGWDATSTACPTDIQPSKKGVYYFAATPPGLSMFANNFIADFAKCFNLTVTNRVRATDLKNPDIPKVTDINAVCQPLAGSPSQKYLHNGYEAGEIFYGLLTDPAMTKNARITMMDVQDYFIGKNGQEVAKIRFTYVDRYNRKNTLLAFATKDTNYATNSQTAGWYNTGNQQPIDINLMVGVRQLTAIPLQDTLGTSRTLADLKVAYRTAFLPLINNDGPGVVLPNGSRLTAVKIIGPGLPAAGLVYIAPYQKGQAEFDFSNQEGILPVGQPVNQLKRCGWQPSLVGGVWPEVPASCPLNWVSQTIWASPTLNTPIVGPKTLTYASPTYPTDSTTQPSGGTWLASGVITKDRLAAQSLMTQGTEYLFILYYGNSSVPTYQYTKRLNTTVPTLAQMGEMPWVKLDNVGGFSINGAISSALASATSINEAVNFETLRPTPNVFTLDVDWTGQSMNTVEISGLNTSLQRAHYPRATPGDFVARGLSYGTLAPQLDQNGINLEIQYSGTTDATTGQPITTGPNYPLQRIISLFHRTWDGSWKSQDFQIETFRR